VADIRKQGDQSMLSVGAAVLGRARRYRALAARAGTRSLRIAIVTSSFLPAIGGMEFVVHNLAMEWGRQGHEVRVVNWETDEASHPDASYSVAKFDLLRGAPRVGYHRFPFSLYSRREIARILDDFDPDFISAHMGYPTGHYLARLRPRRPYVITCHGGDLTLFDWGFRNCYGIDAELREALNASAGAIAISSHARSMMEDLGVHSEVIREIPNGAELERFRRSVSLDIRRHFDLPADSLVVLSVGREHAQKDYATGVRAFAQVAQADPSAHYLLLGKGTDCHRTLAEELGVPDRITFCDGLHGDDLVAAYQQADIFFSPSIWEMMPLVVLEGMASGLPAVVTNISGSQDLVLPGVSGSIVEPNDPDAMATALLGLIRDASLRERYAEAALARSEDYSWDRISRLYLELATPTA
jgi:glycosyltransferase involved in cell wall biosynthesis